MKNKNKLFKPLGLLLPTLIVTLSSCSNNNPDNSSTLSSSPIVSTDGSLISSTLTSTVKMYTEAKVLSKPEKTEIIDLEKNYAVGDWMNFSINNFTGNNLIVTINNMTIEPDSYNRYRYQVKQSDTALIIVVKENVITITPEITYAPAEYSKYVTVKFLTDIKQGSYTIIQFSKQQGYVISDIRINNSLVNYVSRLESDCLNFHIDEDLTNLNIQITVLKSETSSIKLNVSGNEEKTYTIIGNKQYYQINEQATLTISPTDYYRIESVTLNGEKLVSTSPESSSSKVYSFLITPTENLELYITTKPSAPIVKGDIYIQNSTGSISSISKVPGMYVLIKNTTTGENFKTNVDFSNNRSSFITQIDDDNGNYRVNDIYSMQLYIPDGSNVKPVLSSPLTNLKFSFENSQYIQPITLPSNTDLTFNGVVDLPNLPIKVTKSNNVVDDGNLVMISSVRKNVSVNFNLKYTGKIIDSTGVIHYFSNNLSTSNKDFSLSFSLKDGYYNSNDYVITIYHNNKNGKYYMTHNISDNITPDTELNDEYIKALAEGNLIIEFKRTYSKDNKNYVYECFYSINDDKSSIKNLDSFSRNEAVTYIGSNLEYTDNFSNNENKGDFQISTYKITCNDN